MDTNIHTWLVKQKCDVEIQRKDPNSPFYSGKTFQSFGIKPWLLKNIYAMGFNTPSKIEENVLKCLLANPQKNLIAQSQSGTGKTTAFVLGMLNNVETSFQFPQMLCLTTSNELAIQTAKVAAKMCTYNSNIKIKYSVRGEKIPNDSNLTDHIIIGTPDKVFDWSLKQRAFDLNLISLFVVDEADLIMDTKEYKHLCIKIYSQLNPKCVVMFFSATYASGLNVLAEMRIPKALVIRLQRDEEYLNNITQYYVKCANIKQKYLAAINIYNAIDIGQCIIFCNTRRQARWLATQMNKDGYPIAVLSGELSIDERLAAIDNFREAHQKVIIATNVMSRGIDIEQVTTVVNYSMPVNSEGNVAYDIYLHRIGRSGRFGKQGLAINLVECQRTMGFCRDIEKHLNIKIKRLFQVSL